MNGQKILLHVGMEYSLWLSNPRMSILLVLLTLIHVMVIQPLAEAGSQIGEGFHLLEPMAALCNSTLILLILPIGFLILIADYPRLNQGFLLQIYRVGRLNWVLGELLHLCMAAVTYLAAVLLGTFLLSLPYMPVTSPGWSTIATEYMEIMGDSALKSIAGLLPRNLYQQMPPSVAVIRSNILLLFYLVFIGSILLAAGLLRVKFLGIAINSGLLLTGAGFVILNSPWMWGFPCAHALVWIHYTPYFRTPVCPLWASWCYFGLGTALMAFLACIIANQRSFDLCWSLIDMALISIENVSLTIHNRPILRDISAQFEEGQIHGIVGRNGSGKTMLMKCICGFIRPTSGQILVNGKRVGKDVDFPPDMGLLIETPGFVPYYSGLKNLMLLAAINQRVSKQDLNACLERIGLGDAKNKRVSKYSMGMRQRLGIAQAVMENPSLLILDEPLNGLDEQGVSEIRELFLELKERGKTILLSSHNAEDIHLLCDTVYKMKQGELKRQTKEEP